jgi:GNAT superfamily N-acetyltransferase
MPPATPDPRLPAWRLGITNAPAGPDHARVDEGLGQANEAAAPLGDVQPLAAFARNAHGQLLGGAVGRTWGACAELQQLWVQPDHRRQGLGAALVQAFEAAARERGVHTVYLETFSFQAPGLYRALGFREHLAIAGFTQGIVKVTFIKALNEA